MNLLRELSAKPWIATEGIPVAQHDAKELPALAGRTAIKWLFGVGSVLFFLLIVAYGERMTYEDWRPLPESKLLWFNTIALIGSSVAIQWAVIGARRDDIDDVKIGMLSGGITAIVFLAGQLLAWRQLVQMGYFETTNPAIAFFILITGLHALHIIGGLVAWGRTAEKIWRRGFEAGQVRNSVELCAFYWHFLLILWLVLFGLLFAGNNNLSIILAICGLR